MTRSCFVNNEKGQSLVEFALILPILLVLVMGIVQFGFIFNAHITVTHAAREGARLAVVGGNNADVEIRVRNAAFAPLLTINTVTTNRPSPPPAPGGDLGTLSVRVDGSVRVIVPGLNIFFGPGFNVRSTSFMRVERLVTP